jgi:MFS family permease
MGKVISPEKNKTQKERKFFGYPRNIFFTGLTSLLTDTSVKMVYSVMPMFLLSIGATKTSLALIEGIAESTASLVKAFSGFWSDRIGRNKPFLLIGYGLSTGIGTIVALFALYGLYSAATDGIQKAFISDLVYKNKKGTGMGIYNSLLGITLLPASLIAGILYDKVDSRIPFYFGAATAVLSALMMLIFVIIFSEKIRPPLPADG